MGKRPQLFLQTFNTTVSNIFLDTRNNCDKMFYENSFKTSHFRIILLFTLHKKMIPLISSPVNPAVTHYELKLSNCSAVFCVHNAHEQKLLDKKSEPNKQTRTCSIYIQLLFDSLVENNQFVLYCVKNNRCMFARDNQQDVDSFVFLPWTFKEAVCLVRCFAFWDRHQQEAWISVSY